MRALVALLLSATAAAQTAPVAQVASGSDAAPLGAGIRVRYLSLPEWFHGIYSDESVALSSAAFGGEFTLRRDPGFDWLFGVEFANYSPPDGNWLGNGKDPGTKTDYVHFDGVNVIAVDATAVWNTRFSKWFSLVYGAGLGIGIITGEIVRAASAGDGTVGQPCNPDEAGNTDHCYPPSCEAGGCTEQQLAQARREEDPFSDPEVPKCDVNGEQKPCAAFVEDSVPPVIPVVHLLVGARFTLHRHFELRVDTGFHNAFFLGTSAHYMF